LRDSTSAGEDSTVDDEDGIGSDENGRAVLARSVLLMMRMIYS
jgi:hypothetical protein